MKMVKLVVEVPDVFADLFTSPASEVMMQTNQNDYSFTAPVEPIEVESYVAKEDINELTEEFVASAADDEDATREEVMVSDADKDPRSVHDGAIKPDDEVIYPSEEPEGDTNSIKSGYSVNATEFRREAEGRDKDEDVIE